MTPSEQLHLDASAYANKRIAMHKEAIKQQKQTPLDERVHNGTWIAHYEGYVAGCEAKISWSDLTDGVMCDIANEHGLMSIDWIDFARAIEAKLKEKNT
jgi:hypothetical protein